MFALQLLRDGEVVLVHPLGDRPVHIGRHSSNNLILSDPMVSEHHAVLWSTAGITWLRDLASSNGTSVNGDRIKDAVKLKIGDRLTVGGTQLHVAEHATESTPQMLVLVEKETGVCLPLIGDRVRVGSSSDCDMILPDVPAHVLTLFVHNDELWLGTDEEERAVAVGEPFEASGKTFEVRPSKGMENATVVPNTAPGAQAYKVEATLQGPTGANAVVTNISTDKTHVIEAENRAILLYLLARELETQLEANTPIGDAGWCADEDLRRGIWGRNSRDNQLNVLLHRLRGEIRGAGLDPWFIEKRRRYTRLRVAQVQVS